MVSGQAFAEKGLYYQFHKQPVCRYERIHKAKGKINVLQINTCLGC